MLHHPQPGPASPDPPVSPTQLRNMNENILLLMTTTIDHMTEVTTHSLYRHIIIVLSELMSYVLMEWVCIHFIINRFPVSPNLCLLFTLVIVKIRGS